MIFALALASNLNAQQHLSWALKKLAQKGNLLSISKAYQIPCRDGVGADYLNSACLLQLQMHDIQQVQQFLKTLETQAGRVRPSHQISLDIDLIAWQDNKQSNWQFNAKKMPFALDVKVPVYEILPIAIFSVVKQPQYKTIIYNQGYE